MDSEVSGMTEEMDLRQLERASPIIAVAVELGIKVQGSVAMCFNRQAHESDEEKPTLFFNPAKNTFSCKTCPDVGGSVVDLVCQYRGWDREQALQWLAHRAEFDRFTHGLYHGKGRKK